MGIQRQKALLEQDVDLEGDGFPAVAGQAAVFGVGRKVRGAPGARAGQQLGQAAA